MKSEWIELAAAFAATLAFAVNFNVSRGELVLCGAAGLVSEGVYWLAERYTGAPELAALISSAAVTALSRSLANIRKIPVTVYLLAGIIPLVPGAGMYNTIYNFIASDYSAALTVGAETVKAAAAIAVGTVVALALPNRLFFKRRTRQGKTDF